MTRKTTVTLLILLLATLSLQAQHLLPTTVRQYLNERSLGEQGTALSRFAYSRIIDGQEMIDCFISIDNQGGDIPLACCRRDCWLRI